MIKELDQERLRLRGEAEAAAIERTKLHAEKEVLQRKVGQHIESVTLLLEARTARHLGTTSEDDDHLLAGRLPSTLRRSRRAMPLAIRG